MAYGNEIDLPTIDPCPSLELDLPNGHCLQPPSDLILEPIQAFPDTQQTTLIPQRAPECLQHADTTHTPEDAHLQSLQRDMCKLVADFYSVTRQSADAEIHALKTQIEVASATEEGMTTSIQTMETTVDNLDRTMGEYANTVTELRKSRELLSDLQAKLNESAIQNRRHLENISKLILKDRNNSETIRELQKANFEKDQELKKIVTICTMCCTVIPHNPSSKQNQSCLQKESTIALVPCGHRVCCKDCNYEVIVVFHNKADPTQITADNMLVLLNPFFHEVGHKQLNLHFIFP